MEKILDYKRDKKQSISKILEAEKEIFSNYSSIKLDCDDSIVQNILKDVFPLNNLKTLLINLISVQDNNCLSRIYFTVTTDGEYQCHAGANRSLGDLYLLCKYYIPDITLLDTIKTIVEISTTGQKHLHSFICSDIDQRVFLLMEAAYKYNYLSYIEIIKDVYNKSVYDSWKKECVDSPKLFEESIIKDEFGLSWIDFLNVSNLKLDELL